MHQGKRAKKQVFLFSISSTAEISVVFILANFYVQKNIKVEKEDHLCPCHRTNFRWPVTWSTRRTGPGPMARTAALEMDEEEEELLRVLLRGSSSASRTLIRLEARRRFEASSARRVNSKTELRTTTFVWPVRRQRSVERGVSLEAVLKARI